MQAESDNSSLVPRSGSTTGAQASCFKSVFPFGWDRTLLALLMLLACSTTLVGQDLSKASTSGRDRDAAIRSIPFDQMTPETREKLWPILSKPDIYRRLPVVSINCDPDLYLHMVRHPEVVVNIWHLMGITQVESKRVAPFVFDASDGAGTVSRVELVYGTPNLHVMYGEGLYEGSLLKNKITGKCVLVLRSDYYQGANGETLVQNRLDVFLAVDQRGIGMVAKTLHPLVGKAADHNFVESARFLGRMSRTAEENGRGVQAMAQRLESVSPEVRQEFSDLAHLTNQRAVQRLQRSLVPPTQNAGGQIPRMSTPTAAATSSLSQ